MANDRRLRIFVAALQALSLLLLAFDLNRVLSSSGKDILVVTVLVLTILGITVFSCSVEVACGILAFAVILCCNSGPGSVTTALVLGFAIAGIFTASCCGLLKPGEHEFHLALSKKTDDQDETVPEPNPYASLMLPFARCRKFATWLITPHSSERRWLDLQLYDGSTEVTYDENVLYLDRRGFDVGMRCCCVGIGIALILMMAVEVNIITVFPDNSSFLRALAKGGHIIVIYGVIYSVGGSVIGTFLSWRYQETAEERSLFKSILVVIYPAHCTWQIGCLVLALMAMLQYHRWSGPFVILGLAHALLILNRASAPPPNNALAWKRYYSSYRAKQKVLQARNVNNNDPVGTNIRLATRLTEPIVLTCFGDSLLHGTISAPITTILAEKLQAALASELPDESQRLGVTQFSVTKWWLPADPSSSEPLPSLAVVNCAQNGITSEVLTTEKKRLHQGMTFDGNDAEYVLLWIGTNDVRSKYKPNTGLLYDGSLYPSWEQQICWFNSLPFYGGTGRGHPELELAEILDYIGEFCSSPDNAFTEQRNKRHVAILTLPPMGENDLDSPANKLIVDYNAGIQELVDEIQNDTNRKSKFASLSVIPVHDRLVSFLQQEPQQRSQLKGILPKVPVDWFLPVSCLQCALYHSFPGMFTWKSLSARLFGHAVMSDGLHLHETGSGIVADAIVQWLLDHGIADRLYNNQE
jgi:lysophospholipase L1-like esterase